MNEAEDQRALNGRNRGLAIGLGLSPIWLLVILAFLAVISGPGFGGGLTEPTQAEILARQREQLAIYGLAGLLTVAGTALLYRARSTRAAITAALVFTFPALFLVFLGPAFVLILSNILEPAFVLIPTH